MKMLRRMLLSFIGLSVLLLFVSCDNVSGGKDNNRIDNKRSDRLLTFSSLNNTKALAGISINGTERALRAASVNDSTIVKILENGIVDSFLSFPFLQI